MARRPGHGAGGLTAAGVRNVDPQFAVVVTQRDRGGRRAGVPDGIGQRLLDDPIGGQVDGGRQRAGCPGHGEGRLKAGPASAGDEYLQLGSAWRGLGRVGVVGLPQHVEDDAQLPEPLLAGCLDRLQGFSGDLGAAGQDVAGRPGLHVDGSHGVRDDVMQFAGDAQPLVSHPLLGVLLGPVVDRLHVGAAVRHRDPGEQRGRDQAGDQVEAAAGHRAERIDRAGRRHQHDQRRHGQQGGAVDEAEQRVTGHRRGADAQHGDWPPAPPGQRQAGDRDQQQRPRRGLRDRMPVELDRVADVGWMALPVAADHQHYGHHHGEEPVSERRAEPSSPRRNGTFHARRVGMPGGLSRPPRVDQPATPPGAGGTSLQRQ